MSREELDVAKKEKMNDDKPEGVTGEDLKRVITEINRQKGLAAEYSGHAGKATATAVERYGLDRQALSFTRKMAGLEAAKRQSTIRSAIDYLDKMGFFDEVDMFDDVISTMEKIVMRARSNDAGSPAPADGNVVRAMFAQ